MKLKVERIDVTKSYDRNKIYTPVDITSQVVMPIIDVERLDTTLDTSSITLLNNNKTPLKPFTRMKITITNNDGSEEKIYRLIYTDNVEKLNYTTQERYKHYLELIEPTKWLERFEVDNTTITNYLAWLYHEGEGVLIEEASPTILSNDIIGMVEVLSPVYLKEGNLVGYPYNSSPRFNNYYIVNSEAEINVRLNPTYQFGAYLFGIIWLRSETYQGVLEEYTIESPSGQITDAMSLNSYTFLELGEYKFRQKYKATQVFSGTTYTMGETVFEWTSKCVIGTQAITSPQRYTIKEVCNNILNRVGDDASTIRTGIELPLFQLDPNVGSYLDSLISPEFTFTQNTLFGVLSQIGNEIHAIPRLIPTITNIINEDGTITIDDYSKWTTITFDFLGGSEPTKIGEFLGYEGTQNGDNYATSFVSNIQNAFQTNNADYISLTEPHSEGFISTRTEDADYEISNNSACIKTSRSIQRIVSLEVHFQYSGIDYTTNITEFVKEATDYSLLLDYAKTNTEFYGYSTKDSAIYYTRGDNVIRGLDYEKPSVFSSSVVGLTKAIINIISLATGINLANLSGLKLKDLMFRIKYVPFYNLKAKQFKQYIDENSGDNELFYNQVNTQSVDIESLGENIKGALLRTANEEPTITAKYNDAKTIIHAGQLSSDGYYAYEVNKEITNNRIKTTTKFSKDWNKLNEYVAIKKNYREWEISEKESIETTPCYNEFCIISNELDFDNGNPEPAQDASQEEKDEYFEKKQKYIRTISEYGGFLSTNSLIQMFSRFGNSLTIPCSDIFTYDPRQYQIDSYLGDNTWSYYFAPQNIDNYPIGSFVYFGNEQYKIMGIVEDGAISPYIGAKCFEIYVPNSSNLMAAMNNHEDITFSYKITTLRAIEWTVATCKNQKYTTYNSVTEGGITTILCGETVIKKGYQNFTTTTDYQGYYILYNDVPTMVTSVNKDSLGIVPGTTPCYSALPINYTVSYSADTPPLLILTDTVNSDTYQATSQTSIRVSGINYTIEENNGEIILTKKEPDTVLQTFLLPASCCSFGNSILINFGTVDNYSAGTYARNEDSNYALENNVPYSDKYGRVSTLELMFGSGTAKEDGFDTYQHALETSKEYYLFNTEKLEKNNVVLDYSKHDFTVNKDSRQALNFTIQLHFVSDTQNIWIGKALAQSMPFCGNTEENILKFVYFTEKPDKFCQTRDSSIWTEVAMPTCEVDFNLKYIKYDKTTFPEDAVGFGLVDNQNRIVLYYNKEIKAGEQTEPIYFQFRRKI